MAHTFGVVDLFAGPGGLGEGFSAFDINGETPFHTEISVEKEVSAHNTLTLRTFLRQYQREHGRLPKPFIDFHAGLTAPPDWEAVDASIWQQATHTAQCLELGTNVAAETIDDRISRLQRKYDDTVLIGGPPCQAYSLVGRARSRGKHDYVAEKDNRHYLFREYIRVLERLRPAAFVMENVKGMLSSTVENRLVFEMLMESLSSLDSSNGRLYELKAIRVDSGKASLQPVSQPRDFVVHAEEFGAPQRRHRVIIVGIRSDLASKADTANINLPTGLATVGDAIGMLPALRSGLSRGKDSPDAWRKTVIEAATDLTETAEITSDNLFQEMFPSLVQSLQAAAPQQRKSTALPDNYGASTDELLRWLERPYLRGLAQHETRGHMAADLGRYLFAAAFGATHGYSPKARNFPELLRPNHSNWDSGVFSDRFRVQLGNQPSTTVTSHISKDGHYFIHPDQMQCRSLTVREAARLQTFPDDYLFMGNRTQQYVQVGNAVPPFLARQIAALVYAAVTGNATPCDQRSTAILESTAMEVC